MKQTRIISLFFSVFFLTLFALQSLPFTKTVYATGESYTLYWDPANANALKDIFNDGEKQRDIGNQMTLFSRGGVFGEGYNLSFDPDLNHRLNDMNGDDESDEYYASAQLYCKGGQVSLTPPVRPYYDIEYTAAFKANDWNELRNNSNPRLSLGITKVSKIADPKTGEADELLHEKGSGTGPKDIGDNDPNGQGEGKDLSDIENFKDCLDALPRGHQKANFSMFYKLSEDHQKDIKAAITKANDQGNNGNSSDTEGSDNDDRPNCENTGSTLGFFLCPIIEGGSAIGDAIFTSVIKSFLDDIPISTANDDPGFRAWQAFRIIGNIVLIAALLGVVYYQIRGEK